MSLLQKYKESLASQNFNADIKPTPIRKSKVWFYVALIVILFGAPLFYIIAQNAIECGQSFTINTSNTTSTGNVISFKCETNTALYSFSSVLVLVICAMLVLKIFRYRQLSLK